MLDGPFPPPIPLGLEFTGFIGIMGRSDPCQTFSVSFVSSRITDTSSTTLVSLPRGLVVPPRRPGIFFSGFPYAVPLFEESGRSPMFVANPPCQHAPLFDPGGARGPWHFFVGPLVLPSGVNTPSAFPISIFRGCITRPASTRCLRFAVRVAPPPRKTRFQSVASRLVLGFVQGLSHSFLKSCLPPSTFHGAS